MSAPAALALVLILTGCNDTVIGAVPSTARIAAGALHTCILDAQGWPTCWGRDEVGAASPPDRQFAAIGADGDRTCGILSDGTGILCWGYGGGVLLPPPTPAPVVLAVADDRVCTVDEHGTLGCVDDLGVTALLGSGFVAVSARGARVCGLRVDGTSDCYAVGASAFTPFSDDRLTVLETGGGPDACAIGIDGALRSHEHGCDAVDGEPAIALATQYQTGCYLDAGWTPHCWGTFVDPAPDVELAVVEVGITHACGVDLWGEVTCWGLDDGGGCDFGQVTDAP